MDQNCSYTSLDFAVNENDAWANAASKDAGIMASTAYMQARSVQVKQPWPPRSSSLTFQLPESPDKAKVDVESRQEGDNRSKEVLAASSQQDNSLHYQHLFMNFDAGTRTSASTDFMRSAMGGENVPKLDFDELCNTYRGLLNQHQRLLHRQQKIEQQLLANRVVAQHKKESRLSRSSSSSGDNLYTLRYEDTHIAVTRVTVKAEKKNNVKRIMVRIERLSMKLTRAELHCCLEKLKGTGRKAKERVTALRGLSRYRSTFSLA